MWNSASGPSRTQWENRVSHLPAASLQTFPFPKLSFGTTRHIEQSCTFVNSVSASFVDLGFLFCVLSDPCSLVRCVRDRYVAGLSRALDCHESGQLRTNINTVDLLNICGIDMLPRRPNIFIDGLCQEKGSISSKSGLKDRRLDRLALVFLQRPSSLTVGRKCSLVEWGFKLDTSGVYKLQQEDYVDCCWKLKLSLPSSRTRSPLVYIFNHLQAQLVMQSAGLMTIKVVTSGHGLPVSVRELFMNSIENFFAAQRAINFW